MLGPIASRVCEYWRGRFWGLGKLLLQGGWLLLEVKQQNAAESNIKDRQGRPVINLSVLISSKKKRKDGQVVLRFHETKRTK
jgi:hypothetical protein